MSTPVPHVGILFLPLFAAGCIGNGPVRSLAVAANNPAAVERNLDGTVTLRSAQTHLVSVVPHGGRFSRATFTLPSFYVIVTNGGKENVTLQLRDISAYAGDGRVALLDPAALQERLDREDAAAGGSRSGFPADMRDASQPAVVRHGHHRHSPPNAPADGSSGAELRFKVPARLVEQALQPQVIRPFEVGGGRIMLEADDIRSGLPLKIVVTVAGEKHEFLFEVRH